MISAVVLINTDIGLSQDKVVEGLKLVEGVEEAHALQGVYDIMIKIKAVTLEKLKELIKLEIKQVAGVNSTLALVMV